MARPCRLGPRALGIAALALLGACTLGPDYVRPDLAPPASFRGAAGKAEAESIADAGWWTLSTRDPVLQALIREAIANNLDLRVASARVSEARASYGIARSALMPQIDASGGYSWQRVSRLSEPPQASGDRDYDNWNTGVTVSWELDLFGRIRRDTEAAFASYLATEEGQRAVLVSLVADVASTYLLLREYDLQLDIARQTVVANEETVAYYEKRLRGGLSNRLELDRSVANRARTAALIPQFEQQIALAENAICLLLGRAPGPIERGLAINTITPPAAVPVGIPATLLERRPDVLGAEQRLVAANAQVGAAKALFFPTISLTGLLGSLSADASDLLRDDSALRQVNPTLFAPVFEGGRIASNYDAALARYEQAFAEYRQAALQAYREVANALVTARTLGAARRELESGVEALSDAARLSRARYDAGLSSYLEILNADQELLDQRLQLAAVRGDELRALAELYRSLGGGWQPEQAGAPASPAPAAP